MSPNANRVSDGDNNYNDKDNDTTTSQIKLLSLTMEHEEKQEQNNDRKQQDDYEEEKYGNAIEGIRFVNYKDESQLKSMMSLVSRDLSEQCSSEYFCVILFIITFYKLHYDIYLLKNILLHCASLYFSAC